MITKIQRVLRKAVKDYEVKANIGEETLIAFLFLSVDILRELASTESNPSRTRKKEDKNE